MFVLFACLKLLSTCGAGQRLLTSQTGAMISFQAYDLLRSVSGERQQSDAGLEWVARIFFCAAFMVHACDRALLCAYCGCPPSKMSAVARECASFLNGGFLRIICEGELLRLYPNFSDLLYELLRPSHELLRPFAITSQTFAITSQSFPTCIATMRMLVCLVVLLRVFTCVL
jgi:hypothetical protein